MRPATDGGAHKKYQLSVQGLGLRLILIALPQWVRTIARTTQRDKARISLIGYFVPSFIIFWDHNTVRQAKLARSNGCKSRPGKA
jgi:hypothetical protein